MQHLANQRKAITLVEREALHDDALGFRREEGGWPRLNRLFDAELEPILHQFQQELGAA